MRKAAFLLTLVALAGCVSPSRHHAGRRAPPRAGGPPRSPEPAAAVTRQCLARLDAAGIRYTPLPDRRGPGACSQIGTIRLDDYGIPTTSLGPMRCGLAEALVAWVRGPVQQAAARVFGEPVLKVESFGSYACRPVNNAAGERLSEHGVANAVDIAAFVLADGRRITVLDGWNGDDAAARRFLRAVHDSACASFGVVLGPDANTLHRNHLHLDMAPERYCR